MTEKRTWEDLAEKVKFRYIKELMKYLKMKDSIGLRELSNNLIEEAVVTEDPINIDMSLVAYSLSKLVSKPHFYKSEGWREFEDDIISHMSEISDKNAGHILEIIMNDIKKFDIETGNYIEDLIEKARVKQASRAYAMGLSLGKAAELTGVDKAYLISYIGLTKIHDRPFTQSKSVVDRYKYLKELLDK